MASEQRFGYEWDTYHMMSPSYERQFRNWTHPLTPDDWAGKRFLDAGCGMGRNSYWPMRWRAASCVAFDNDERSLARARETLKEFPAAEVVRKNIDDIAWRSEFDIAFSIGVIHHLDDPKSALCKMAEALKPAGKLLIWVYSYEDNALLLAFLNPIRRHVTSRLPLPLVHFLAYFLSVPLYIFVKIFRGPSNYLKQISSFDFWHVHSIVFDQLIPTVAFYWKQSEVAELVTGLPLRDAAVTKTPEGTGWILTATKI